MDGFPDIGNHAKPEVNGNRLTFTYVNSWSEPITETRPVLTADEVIKLLVGRMKRFQGAPPGARESDRTRSERKYLAAQPRTVLMQAYKQMTADQRDEFRTMLDRVSYSGISDPKWAKRQSATASIVGDDEKPLR